MAEEIASSEAGGVGSTSRRLSSLWLAFAAVALAVGAVCAQLDRAPHLDADFPGRMKLVGAVATVVAGVAAIFSDKLVQRAQLKPMGFVLCVALLIGGTAAFEGDRLQGRDDAATAKESQNKLVAQANAHASDLSRQLQTAEAEVHADNNKIDHLNNLVNQGFGNETRVFDDQQRRIMQAQRDLAGQIRSEAAQIARRAEAPLNAPTRMILHFSLSPDDPQTRFLADYLLQNVGTLAAQQGRSAANRVTNTPFIQVDLHDLMIASQQPLQLHGFDSASVPRHPLSKLAQVLARLMTVEAVVAYHQGPSQRRGAVNAGHDDLAYDVATNAYQLAPDDGRLSLDSVTNRLELTITESAVVPRIRPGSDVAYVDDLNSMIVRFGGTVGANHQPGQLQAINVLGQLDLVQLNVGGIPIILIPTAKTVRTVGSSQVPLQYEQTPAERKATSSLLPALLRTFSGVGSGY